MQISHGVKDEDMQNILPESSLCLGQHIIYLSVIFFRAGQVVKLLVASY